MPRKEFPVHNGVYKNFCKSCTSDIQIFWIGQKRYLKKWKKEPTAPRLRNLRVLQTALELPYNSRILMTLRNVSLAEKGKPSGGMLETWTIRGRKPGHRPLVAVRAVFAGEWHFFEVNGETAFHVAQFIEESGWSVDEDRIIDYGPRPRESGVKKYVWVDCHKMDTAHMSQACYNGETTKEIALKVGLSTKMVDFIARCEAWSIVKQRKAAMKTWRKKEAKKKDPELAKLLKDRGVPIDD